MFFFAKIGGWIFSSFVWPLLGFLLAMLLLFAAISYGPYVLVGLILLLLLKKSSG